VVGWPYTWPSDFAWIDSRMRESQHPLSLGLICHRGTDARAAPAIETIPGVSPSRNGACARGHRRTGRRLLDARPHIQRPTPAAPETLPESDRRSTPNASGRPAIFPTVWHASCGSDTRLPRQPGGFADLLDRAQLMIRVLDTGQQRAGPSDLGSVTSRSTLPYASTG